jgi:hypothetical protein
MQYQITDTCRRGRPAVFPSSFVHGSQFAMNKQPNVKERARPKGRQGKYIQSAPIPRPLGEIVQYWGWAPPLSPPPNIFPRNPSPKPLSALSIFRPYVLSFQSFKRHVDPFSCVWCDSAGCRRMQGGKQEPFRGLLNAVYNIIRDRISVGSMAGWM